jgi:WD40 repeat protein
MGNWLILTSSGSAITVRLADPSNVLVKPLQGYSGGAISFSPGGNWMVEQPNPSYVTQPGHSLRTIYHDPLLWHITDASIGEPSKIAGSGNPLRGVTFADQDTALLATEEVENEYSHATFETPDPPVRAFLWHLRPGKGLMGQPAVISGHRGAVSAAFSRDGSWLATTDGIFQQRIKRVQLWRTNDLAHPVFAFEMEAPAQVFYPMFDPTGTWFIFGNGRTAGFYSLHRLHGPGPFNPDFEIESGTRISAHWKLYFSSDTRWFVNEGYNEPVRIWWRSPGKEIDLKGEATDQSEAEVAFTHGSNYLITSSREATAIWTLGSSSGSIQRATLPGAGEVLLDPDEGRMTTFTSTGPRAWILGIDELIALTQNVVARNMTLDEWTQVLPGTQYQKTFTELPVDVSVIQSYVEQANTAANKNNRADAAKWISLAAATAIDSKNPFAATRVADAGLSNNLTKNVYAAAEFAAGAMPNDPGAMELRGISRAQAGDFRGVEDLRRFVAWALQHGATQEDLKKDFEFIQTAKDHNARSPN